MRANDDLRGAEIDLAAAPPLLGDAAFHCQQAAEKALKGLLTWHDREFRKMHDLVELGGQCVAIGASLEPVLRRAAPLTEYAWRHRYPGEPFVGGAGVSSERGGSGARAPSARRPSLIAGALSPTAYS